MEKKTELKKIAKKTNSTASLKKTNKIPRYTRDPDREIVASPWLEDYLDLFSFQYKPITVGFVERLCEELTAWSKEDSSIVLRDFYDNKDIPEDAYYRWVSKYPNLAVAHEAAKGRIGARREKGAMNRKFDSGIATMTMPMYDRQWKEFVEWKSKLRAQEVLKEAIKIELSDLARKDKQQLPE